MVAASESPAAFTTVRWEACKTDSDFDFAGAWLDIQVFNTARGGYSLEIFAVPTSFTITK